MEVTPDDYHSIGVGVATWLAAPTSVLIALAGTRDVFGNTRFAFATDGSTNQCFCGKRKAIEKKR